MIDKLKSQRGETLVETMASIIIAVLSVALLFTCVMAGAQIDRMAQDADVAYYADLTAAEMQMGEGKSGKVTIIGSGTTEIPISLYGGAYGGEGMYSYARNGG